MSSSQGGSGTIIAPRIAAITTASTTSDELARRSRIFDQLVHDVWLRGWASASAYSSATLRTAAAARYSSSGISSPTS